MKKLLIFSALAATALLGACGKQVSIEPGYIGKLNTPSGLSEETIPPSKIRLNGMCFVCDDLYLLEASDRRVVEKITVFMPKDQLNIDMDVRATLAIENDPATVNPIFARIPAEETAKDRIFKISFARVYQTYGEAVIRESVRGVMVKYTIDQIMEKREEISAELQATVRNRLKGTPITVKNLGMADVQFPPTIVEAKIAVREAEEGIKKAKAAEELALKQQTIDLIEADTQVKVAKKLAEGVSEAFVTQRWLKVMEQLASNDQKTVIILPAEAIGDPSVMMPTMNRAYK